MEDAPNKNMLGNALQEDVAGKNVPCSPGLFEGALPPVKLSLHEWSAVVCVLQRDHVANVGAGPGHVPLLYVS